MIRPATLPADIRDLLAERSEGADIAEITDALREIRRAPVLRHSVRSAIYQNLEGNGHNLFVRIGRGRYGSREQV